MILGIGECLVNAAVTLTITQSSSHRYNGGARSFCVEDNLDVPVNETNAAWRAHPMGFPKRPTGNMAGIVFMTSDAGSDVNGQVIAVGGGANLGSAAY